MLDKYFIAVFQMMPKCTCNRRDELGKMANSHVLNCYIPSQTAAERISEPKKQYFIFPISKNSNVFRTLKIDIIKSSGVVVMFAG